MSKELFTKAEAEAKVGKRIRTLVDFSGVPKGMTGTVIRADQAGQGYDLAIQWDLPTSTQAISTGEVDGEPFTLIRTGKPLVDWFTKDEYERFLIEDKGEQE